MLRDGLAQLSREFNIERFVRVSGVPCSPYQMFFDGNEQYWPALRTLYLQETIRHGVLIPYIAPSFSHTETDVSRTLDASRKALQVLRQAIDRGTTDGLLIGPAVKPVFRKFN